MTDRKSILMSKSHVEHWYHSWTKHWRSSVWFKPVVCWIFNIYIYIYISFTWDFPYSCAIASGNKPCPWSLICSCIFCLAPLVWRDTGPLDFWRGLMGLSLWFGEIWNSGCHPYPGMVTSGHRRLKKKGVYCTRATFSKSWCLPEKKRSHYTPTNDCITG